MRDLFQIAFLAVLLAGCATSPYTPPDLQRASFLERSISQTTGDITATVAVPDETETEALFGLPLYEQGIQPVWVEVRNNGSTHSRLSVWSLDPDYFSPMEVAWMNRRGFSKAGKAEMERWFHFNAIERRIPPGESRSGFVYTNTMPGTKGFNLDVFTGNSVESFTFFVPMPGFTADYMLVDFENLYGPNEIIDIPEGNLPAVRRSLEALPCCSTDPAGTEVGGPFNVVLIGTGTAVRRMLLRAAWHETEARRAENSVAHQNRYRDRPPDGVFYKSRADGTERRELRLWLAPYRYGSEYVWLGQVGYDLSEATDDPTDYVIDPDADKARDYLFQNVWYSQSLARAGFVDGAPTTTREAPVRTFTGNSFFTDGLRVVLFLSEEPVASGDAQIIALRSMNP
jgi:hypothetical protein